MKLTLLDMVQKILMAIEADDVNSIADTPESVSAAEIVEAVYFQMLTWATTPELATAYFPLEGLGDVLKPNYLKLPDDVDELFWFKYDIQDTDDTQRVYANIKFMDTESFFRRLMSRDLSEAEVTEITSDDGVPLWIYNDRNPEVYTILNDKHIVTDAYDKAVDATLQGSKTVASGKKHPTFTVSDSFIPDLDANLFPYLLAESKSIAFVEIKQSPNGKQEQISREQKVRHQNERHRFSDRNEHNVKTEGTNFGRRRP